MLPARWPVASRGAAYRIPPTKTAANAPAKPTITSSGSACRFVSGEGAGHNHAVPECERDRRQDRCPGGGPAPAQDRKQDAPEPELLRQRGVERHPEACTPQERME